MFGLFKKDPIKKLEKEHAKLLEQARDKQRNGELVPAGELMQRAEEVLAEIDRLQQEKATN